MNTYDIEVSSNINPTGVFSPQMTRSKANQQLARAHQAGDIRGVQKQIARPGARFNSAANVAAAAPIAAANYAQGAGDAAGTRLQDMSANQANLLQMELDRAMQAMGAANTAQQMQGYQNQYQLGQEGLRQGLLAQLLALFGG